MPFLKWPFKTLLAEKVLEYPFAYFFTVIALKPVPGFSNMPHQPVFLIKVWLLPQTVGKGGSG